MNINTVTIDLRTAVLLLVKVVKSKGADYRPENSTGTVGCNYTEGQYMRDVTVPLVPLCIVGHVFSNLGILRAVFNDEGSEWATCGPQARIWDNAEAMGVTFTEDARQFFRDAQQKQDSGNTWGDALSFAFAAAQDSALDNFKQSCGLFTGHLPTDVDLAAHPVYVEPLAEWERELLGQ